MLAKTLEDLKAKIFNLYTKDITIEKKINLMQEAKSIKDPGIEEFNLELQHVLEYQDEPINTDNLEELSTAGDELIEESEEPLENPHFDLQILEQVDKKVLSILHSLNVSLYRKDDLKKLIISDMLDDITNFDIEEEVILEIENSIPKMYNRVKFIRELQRITDFEMKKFLCTYYQRDIYRENLRVLDKNITDANKIRIWAILNYISWYIENHVEHEFENYHAKKLQIEKDLLTDLLNRILPVVNEQFIEHRQKRSKKINTFQINNFLNFLMDHLDKNFIQIDKQKKKLNNEDYLFLKNKIKLFITTKYYNVFMKQTKK